LDFIESFGVDMSVLSQLGGHTRARTHRNKSGPNIGFAIINAIKDKAKSLDPMLKIIESAPVVEISPRSEDKGRVKYKHDGKLIEVCSKSIIVATGGFSSGQELLHQYAPSIENYPTTNGPWATGDGIRLLSNQSKLIDMDQVQIHPTGFVNPKDPAAHTKFLAPEALRGSGGNVYHVLLVKFLN
jgi:aspartate oxidase